MADEHDIKTEIKLEVGTRVRLLRDASRIGVLLGRIREQGSIRKRQVQFPDGVQYVPEDQLEAVGEGLEDPIDLLERGRLGDALDLRRTLTHARLTGKLADVIYSMDTTGTDFYAYQFKPVVKLLNSAGRGILIADEVGLGKTIEAGLLWTEFRSRFDFRRLFILCPAVLREKWQRELHARFGVEADILDAHAALAKLKWAADEGSLSQFAIISSLQGLRPRRGWGDAENEQEGGAASQLARFLQERDQEEPLIDVCVIDEAHYLRNPETMTAALGRVFRTVTDYMVLLSATPVHLRSDDLFQLLNLVDEDTFRRRQSFKDVLEANRPLVEARDLVLRGRASLEELRDLLLAAAGHPLLMGSRQLDALLRDVRSEEELRDPAAVAHLAHRLERVNLLGHAVTRTRKREVTEWSVLRDPIAEEIQPNALEMAFYKTVTEVVREFCMRREAHEGFLLVTPQRQMSSSMPAALRFWQQGGLTDDNELWEDFGLIDDGDGERPLLRELVSRAKELGDLDDLWRNDSKYERVRERLRKLFERNPREKVVLFSYFRATLAYLHERLLADGINNIVMHGGSEDKDQIVTDFRESSEGMVLLSSEVGSEGIDLQFAKTVINYDLPWNPMRVEQRIGRVDRLGQASPVVHVWNLFYAHTIDSRIYHRLFERLKIFEGALGALEPVLGDKIQNLARDLFSGHLTAEQEEARIEQTELALESNRLKEEHLEADAAHLVAYGDYIVNQVNAARELKRTIDASDVRTYVIEFFKLHYPGCDFRQKSDDPNGFAVSLSFDAKHDFARYLRDERLDGATRLTRNDIRSLPCRFENSAVATTRGREELLSQFHPLVRFVGKRITELEEQRRPAVAICVAHSDLDFEIEPGDYAFGVQRWGVEGLRAMERLHYVAIRLDEEANRLSDEASERLIVGSAGAGRDWPGAQFELEERGLELRDLAETIGQHCVGAADTAFERYVAELQAENEDRAGVQKRTVEMRSKREREMLEQVRDKHQRLGRTALVSATEGRLRALEFRYKGSLRKIEEARHLTSKSEDVCIGVIKVTSS